MKYVLALFYLTFAICAHAQRDDLFKLGQVKAEEIAMKSYLPDTSAEAVVLEDRGYSTLTHNSTNGYQIIYRRYKRIKILKKSAYNYATVNIGFYVGNRSSETVRNIKARTYNGSDFKDLEATAVFEEKKSDKIFLKKFTFPDVKEGSVIEYCYDMDSDFVMQLRDWEFQTDIPTVKSEYWLDLIPNFSYRILYNKAQFTINAEEPSLTGIIYHWAMEDIAALRDEPFITTLEDFRAKLWFELIAANIPGNPPQKFSTTWDAIDQTLLYDNDFGRVSNKTRFLKDVVAEIKVKVPEKDTLQRIRAAYDFMVNNISWDGKTRYWADRSLKEVYEKRGGSSAEINLMLLALLRELDLEANPVVLSARSNGVLSKDYPLISKLDYVIVQTLVNGKDLLLDATSKYRKIGIIPFDCLNGEGRIINKKSRWIELKPAETQSQNTVANLEILPTGQLKGQITETNTAYSAAGLRRVLVEDGIEKYKEKIPKNNPDWQVSKFEVEHLSNPDQNLKFITDGVFGEEQETDKLYINPIVANRQKNNPFKSSERSFPVDFGVVNIDNYIATITIPDGYVVEELPKGANYVLPNGGGRFLYDIQQQGNKLQITVRQVLSKTKYSPQEYYHLREFYVKIVAKEAEIIVLKKK